MTRQIWTSADRAVIVADLNSARNAGNRANGLIALKALVQKPGDFRQSDLTTLTENITANLVPALVAGTYVYTLAATSIESSVTLTATLAGATILYTYGATVNKSVASGVGEAVALTTGANVVTIKVSKPGYGSVTYTITVTRAA